MSAFETYESYEGPFESQETYEGPYGHETSYETYEGEDEQFLGSILGTIAKPLAQAGMSALQQGLSSGFGGLFGETESPLSEAQEMELATELLEITSEEELEEFLGNLFKGVSNAVGGIIRSPVGQQLGGILKGVAKQALPVVGGALGSFVAPGVGTAIGSQLGSMASNLFEMETEGMSQEQAQFEVARRYVRLASTAAGAAARAPRNVPPARVTRVAITQAARQHAPGLLRGTSAGTGQPRRVPQGAGPGQPGRPPARPGAGRQSPRGRRPLGYAAYPTYVTAGNGHDQAPQPGWGEPEPSWGGGGQWAPQPEPSYGASAPQAAGRARSGRWVRRGSKIVIYGV
jgi:uncharacterized protein (DUF697 family)